MKRLVRVSWVGALATFTAAFAPVACSSQKDSAIQCDADFCPCPEGASCECPPGATCDDIACGKSCRVACTEESKCLVSGGGSFQCGEYATCDFFCNQPPCDVWCEGNDHCAGECDRGTCTCGVNSQCFFQCIHFPCHVVCMPGSSCLIGCGSIDQPFDCEVTCLAGGLIRCPDGFFTCNAPCPTTP